MKPLSLTVRSAPRPRHPCRGVPDRASAATDGADHQRYATESRRQNPTNFRNAQPSVVSCKPLLGGGVLGSVDDDVRCIEEDVSMLDPKALAARIHSDGPADSSFRVRFCVAENHDAT